MDHFNYKSGELYCEDIPLAQIADQYGTPCYVYSHATLVRHFREFDDPFASFPHLTCYSVKASSNLAILRLFANLGGGFDVVSGGELFRVLEAGGDPGKVVYSGVGKTEDEIRYALKSDILMFNIESEAELFTIERVAQSEGVQARISFRVNPDVNPGTHPYIATGLREAKFGIDVERSRDLYARARELEHVKPVGVDCHIGSQLTQTAPLIEALMRLLELITVLRKQGADIKYLDLGGGLGITYRDEKPPLPREYAEDILAVAKNLDVSLILEPGRVIAGNAGVLLTRVLYVKDTKNKRFVIVDAAMNDCIRPSLYDAYHEIKPVIEPEKTGGGKEVVADVVGPICESADFLAKNRLIPELGEKDLMAVMSAGAYCASMASNYNSRPRAAEVLVANDKSYLIGKRETREDLVRRESIPDFLSNT